MSKKVYAKDWLRYKPYSDHSNVDYQYIEVANRINKILQKVSFLKNQLQLDEDDVVELAVFLTCYLEDVVSETNVWNTFIAIHKEKYRKSLPFYSTKNYTEGEINLVDIQFLIWYFLNLDYPERFLSPYDGYLEYLAEDVFLVLDYEFDYVDENIRLKECFILHQNSDYYEARRKIQFVLFESYLFKIDAGAEINEKVNEILEEHNEKNNREKATIIDQLVYSTTDKVSNLYNTKLLAMRGKEWLAEIIGSSNSMYETVKNISNKISGYFLYKGENKSSIHFQHIASDVIFDLTKESFDAKFKLSDDNVYYLEMVLWKNEWTFSGVAYVTDFDANLILDEKNDTLKINAGNQYDEKYQLEAKNALKIQEDAFVRIFKSHILFVDAKDVQKTLNRFTNEFNISLSTNEEEHQQTIEEAKNRMRQKGYFGEDSSFDKKEEGNFVVYFNPSSGIEIFKDICNIFPDKNNQFYEREDEQDIKMFLFSPIYSKELTEYFIENYAHKLDYFKTGTGKKYLNDLDFLLRFWKNENYHSKPSITLL